MLDQKNKHSATAKATSEMESFAERYLDLWQENVKRWATDPDALEKWVKEASDQINPTDKNTR